MREKKNYVVVDQSLRLLRLCLDQGILLDRQVTSWIHANYKYGSQNAVRSVQSRLFKRLKSLKWVESKKSATTLRQQLCVSKDGIEVLRDAGYLTEPVQYRGFDPIFENHNILATDVRLAWQGMIQIAFWETERVMRSRGTEVIPDACFVYHDGELNEGFLIANEIELTQKSEPRYVEIFKQYQRSQYNFVFYYVSNLRLKDLILEISKPLSNKIFVCLVSEFVQNQSETWFHSNFGTFKIGERFKLI